MANETDRDAELDALLSEAKEVRPDPDLVARVLADAAAVQGASAESTLTSRRGGLFRNPPRLVAALGGWGGFGGVTAAGLVGLAVGFWSPDAVDMLSGGAFWTLAPGSGWTPDLAELALENVDA
jgi:hypothetical protein